MGLQTLVDFLHKKGFDDVEANPAARITDEQYALVQSEFNKDKGVRSQVEQMQAARKTKEKKETIVLTDSDEALPLTEVKRPKVVGRIDLDAKGEPVAQKKEKVEKTPKAEKTVEPEKPAPSTKEQKSEAEQVTKPAPVATEPKAEPAQTPVVDSEASAAISAPRQKKQKERQPIGEEVDGVFRLNTPVEPDAGGIPSASLIV